MLQFIFTGSHCFRKLGELLQIRRKRELYDTHSLYIEESAEDPANKDTELQRILNASVLNSENEIEKLCQE